MTAKHTWENSRSNRQTAKPPPATTTHHNRVYTMYTHRTGESRAGEPHRERDHMTATLDHSDTPAIDTQEPTPEGLKEVITGLPIVRDPNLIRDENCNRCDRKNRIRRNHDLPQRDPAISDGERVTLICGYSADPDQTNGWEIRAVHHTDHPTKDKDDVATPGHAVAEATARLDGDGWTYTQPALTDDQEPEEYHVEDRSVVRDVEITWFSPVDEGQDRERTVELDDEGIAAPKPTDPIPDWPDAENEWRREIIQELGE